MEEGLFQLPLGLGLHGGGGAGGIGSSSFSLLLLFHLKHSLRWNSPYDPAPYQAQEPWRRKHPRQRGWALGGQAGGSVA